MSRENSAVVSSRKVSIVIPVYNEELNLPKLLPRLFAALEPLQRPYEIILVDDGSRDRSMSLMREFAANYPKTLCVVQLSRNYGQHQAILAGFTRATGAGIVTLDADLQNPPEEIPKLISYLDQGYDVVGGIRKNRHDPLFRRLASYCVNRITVATTGMHLEDYGCMLRGYSREIIDQINRCEEHSTFIPALAHLFANRTIEVEVEQAPRAEGKSSYSFYKLIRLNFDLMTGFSVVPLQLFTLFGFVVAGGGFFFGIYLLVRRYLLLRQSEAEGVFTLFALAFVVMGVLMAGLGIVGEYIGRIYQEVRQRPRFLIRQVYGHDEHPESRTLTAAAKEML